MIVKLANIAVEGDIYTLAVLKKTVCIGIFLLHNFQKSNDHLTFHQKYLLGVVQTHGLNVVKEEI